MHRDGSRSGTHCTSLPVGQTKKSSGGTWNEVHNNNRCLHDWGRSSQTGDAGSSAPGALYRPLGATTLSLAYSLRSLSVSLSLAQLPELVRRWYRCLRFWKMAEGARGRGATQRAHTQTRSRCGMLVAARGKGPFPPPPCGSTQYPPPLPLNPELTLQVTREHLSENVVRVEVGGVPKLLTQGGVQALLTGPRRHLSGP